METVWCWTTAGSASGQTTPAAWATGGSTRKSCRLSLSDLIGRIRGLGMQLRPLDRAGDGLPRTPDSTRDASRLGACTPPAAPRPRGRSQLVLDLRPQGRGATTCTAAVLRLLLRARHLLHQVGHEPQHHGAVYPPRSRRPTARARPPTAICWASTELLDRLHRRLPGGAL